MDVKNKHVLVVGMARSGEAAARFLVKLGAFVTINDAKPEAEFVDILHRLSGEGIRVELGQSADCLVAEHDLIVVSPGVPTDMPFFAIAKEKGIPVVGEMELGCQFVQCPIIAITGTNGKTTTTALMGKMLERTGRTTYVAGNIGNPITDFALDTEPDQWMVVEVSSFQLETIKEFRPRVSAILNITEDHLNRHKTMENYIRIKARIFENQRDDDVLVLNYDQLLTRALGQQAKCKVIYFSRQERVPAGVCILDEKITYISPSGDAVPIGRPGEVRIPGAHNLENAMAAVAIGMTLGIPVPVVRHTLATFEGVEHRIEFVDEIAGIRFINDSKGTNPDAPIASVRAMELPTILIAGGYDKGNDFTPWIESFTDRIAGMVVIGNTADKITACAKTHGFDSVVRADSLRTAVDAAIKMAKPGYNVLLSPACASFDMFKDYEERGRAFKQIVAEVRGRWDAQKSL